MYGYVSRPVLVSLITFLALLQLDYGTATLAVCHDTYSTGYSLC